MRKNKNTDAQNQIVETYVGLSNVAETLLNLLETFNNMEEKNQVSFKYQFLKDAIEQDHERYFKSAEMIADAVPNFNDLMAEYYNQFDA